MRSSQRAFGVDSTDVGRLVGHSFDLRRFFATTLDERIARDEFTVPSLSGGAVLLRIAVPQGTPAAWVALVGELSMARQRELLLGPGITLGIVGVSYNGDIPVLDVEVI